MHPNALAHKAKMLNKQLVLSAAATTILLFRSVSSFSTTHSTITPTKPRSSISSTKTALEMSSDIVIRDATAADLDNLKQVIDSSELFPSEMLDDMIAGYLAGTEDCLWLTADDPTLVAYCAPEKMTECTWNLYLIAVHKNKQGTGIGTKALQHLQEQLVAKKSARILLVETSALPEFEQTRHFYLKMGFVEEARIRDYYQEGEDKVVYWKSLVTK